eukprot:m.460083 g.460083  ORF g.460083 m.460083 type:complete len:239 (-) comp21589_c1_seq3:1028-1744(-)
MKKEIYVDIISAVYGWYRGLSGGKTSVCRDERSLATGEKFDHETLFDVLRQVSRKLNVPFEVVRAVYSSETKQILKNLRIHSKGKKYYFEFYMKYRKENRSMLDLANDERTSSLLVAEKVFEYLFDQTHPTVSDRWAERQPNKRGSLIKDLMYEYCSAPTDRAHFPMQERFQRDLGVGTVLGNALHADMIECLHHEGCYGPFVDRLKHMIGREYEHTLEEKLRQLNVCPCYCCPAVWL